MRAFEALRQHKKSRTRLNWGGGAIVTGTRTTIRDLIDQDSGAFRKQPLLHQLADCLHDDGPVVTWLMAADDSSKAELLAGFEALAKTEGARLLRIDCRNAEPTAAGLLHCLSEILDCKLASQPEATAAISQLAERVVLVFDNYDVFRLADAWLRRDFIPALEISARVLLVSRESASVGWANAPEWQAYFRAVSAAPATANDRQRFARASVAEIEEPALLEALQAVSVVRRVTRPILENLCPTHDAVTLYETIAELPFTTVARDGLVLQEAEHRELSGRLWAADQQRYRSYQRRAWKVLRQQLAESPRADLWRITADLIFLLENPVIREAFFPSKSAQFAVEPAMPGDEAAILNIVNMHDPDARDILALWWQQLPGAFHAVRSSTRELVGFYCMARPDELGAQWMSRDPVARRWLDHLQRKGRQASVPALFLRRWLSLDAGESPSSVQAAAWVDIKRTYLELRPELRRVYLPLINLEPYGPVATELGFKVLNEEAATVGATTYHTAMLDFGPGSVDGWIANLVAAELGIDQDQLLNPASRELSYKGNHIALTPLEYGVLAMLESRDGQAVSRNELLRDVWGHGYEGGSNVVDAVVRGLRKKLGDQASILETVRGVGYRLTTEA